MNLLSTDLYRSFVIGFGVGAAALLAVMAMQGDERFSPSLIPTAEAAAALPDNTLAQPAR